MSFQTAKLYPFQVYAHVWPRKGGKGIDTWECGPDMLTHPDLLSGLKRDAGKDLFPPFFTDYSMK